MTGSDFSWGKYGDELVYIVDLDKGNMSATNDMENIMLALVHRYKVSLKGVGVIYRDSMGEWARVLHIKGVFKGFVPISKGSRTMIWKDEIQKVLEEQK